MVSHQRPELHLCGLCLNSPNEHQTILSKSFNSTTQFCIYSLVFIIIYTFYYRHLCKCLLTAPLLLDNDNNKYKNPLCQDLFAIIQIGWYGGMLSAEMLSQSNAGSTKWHDGRIKQKREYEEKKLTSLMLLMMHLLP